MKRMKVWCNATTTKVACGWMQLVTYSRSRDKRNRDWREYKCPNCGAYVTISWKK